MMFLLINIIKDNNMKKLFIFLFLIIILSNCSLIQPAYLSIKNKSHYTIIVKLDNGNKKKLKLDKSKGDYILVYSNKIKINISIDEIGFNKNYLISFNYLEKKEFIFSINE